MRITIEARGPAGANPLHPRRPASITVNIDDALAEAFEHGVNVDPTIIEAATTAATRLTNALGLAPHATELEAVREGQVTVVNNIAGTIRGGRAELEAVMRAAIDAERKLYEAGDDSLPTALSRLLEVLEQAAADGTMPGMDVVAATLLELDDQGVDWVVLREGNVGPVVLEDEGRAALKVEKAGVRLAKLSTVVLTPSGLDVRGWDDGRIVTLLWAQAEAKLAGHAEADQDRADEDERNA